MPFRLDEHRAKIQFVTSAAMPSMIFKACLATGMVSNTAYIQRAVCEALARDLDLDLDELLASLPPHRGNSKVLFGDERRQRPDLPGPANTMETVR
jgi:hypothetical protein